MFAGMRDVTAHGAGEWATTRLVGAAKTSAAATSAVAKANTARALVVALGCPVAASGRAGRGGGPRAGRAAQHRCRGWCRNVRDYCAGSCVAHHGAQRRRLAGPARRPYQPHRRDCGGRAAKLRQSTRLTAGRPLSPLPRRSGIPAMALVTHGLRFRYGAGADDVVNGLDLLVPAGDHFAIVGPSGGGKSTLALLLAAVSDANRRQCQPRRPGRSRNGPPPSGIGPSPLSRSRRTFSPGPCRRT